VLLDTQVNAKLFPTLVDISRWTSQLEVIYIDHQEEFKAGVEVARGPRGADWLETRLLYSIVTMLLPIGATVGVAV
jgi:hypothetical protein